MAESILQQFPADEYPHLAATITEHVTKSGYDYADEFEVGLDPDPRRHRAVRDIS